MGEHRTPVHDQSFFLNLARRGREEWNRWCDDNRTIRVTFENFKFEYADFSGFKFGLCSKFRGATFEGRADFSRATFDDEADFRGATFGDGADFSGATFGVEANLSRTTFRFGAYLRGATFKGLAKLSNAIFEDADLSGATFGDYAELHCVTFGDSANLSGISFGDYAEFYNATFRGRADLSGATFGHNALFYGVTFRGLASLSGATFGDEANFVGATFNRADFTAQSRDDWEQQMQELVRFVPHGREKEFWEARRDLHRFGNGPDAFRRVYFRGAHFMDVADFSGRNFLGRCDLTGTRFDEPPVFDNCQGTARIDLYGSKIAFFGERPRLLRFLGKRPKLAGWTTDTAVGIRLRALRNLADETKNHDLERDLYIEERKAERGIVLAPYWREANPIEPTVFAKPTFLAHCRWIATVLSKPRFLAHCIWIAAMGGYWLLSDYGRSFVRPLFGLVVSIFIFQQAYSVVLIPPSKVSVNTFEHAVWAFSLANAVPFVGALTLEKEMKEIILCAAASSPGCEPVPKKAFQLLALAQSIVSGLLLFFIALALRNFFKLG